MQPFTLLIKPSGSDCNIDCSYCFYKNRAPEIGQGRQRMTAEVLETLTRDYLKLGFPVNNFSWQGGEPTLMGLDFYRQAVAFQKEYGQAQQQVTNALQTNGLLINDEWGTFLQKHGFLVGISCDGPQEIHDHFRKDLGGHGTWERVIKGIRTCQGREVEFNILILVNRLSADHPDAIIDFFLEMGIHWLQFIPCVERDPDSGGVTDFSVTPKQYGDFLCRVFDRWIELGPTQLSIRDFDSMVHYCVTGRHTICTFGRQCADYIVIEHDGAAYPCDFFVKPELCLGNITETPIDKLAASTGKRDFARQKTKLVTPCLICEHLNICRGACMKDRILPLDRQDGPCQSYFCPSYKTFFAYALPRLRQMAAQVYADLTANQQR